MNKELILRIFFIVTGLGLFIWGLFLLYIFNTNTSAIPALPIIGGISMMGGYVLISDSKKISSYLYKLPKAFFKWLNT
jgi:hypothetical protein